MNTDSGGNFPFAAIVKIAIATAIVFKVVRHVLKQVNKKNNGKADNNPKTSTKGKIINDQNGVTGNTFHYGAYPARRNACETIAVHNAKVLKGNSNSTLSQTITDFQDANAMIGFGILGSNPYSIGKVLENERISYSRVGINGMNKPGVYIISFWNDNPLQNGLHTVAINYDGSNYTAYNFASEYDGDPVSLSYFKNRFICAYYVG